MNRFRPFILAVLVLAAAFMAYGLFTLPRPQGVDAEGFSSERVVKDIEVMSKEHHSVAHPQERAKVREYLVDRLYSLGADTVRIFTYDSLVGPKNKHVVYTFDAHNVMADFPALNKSVDGSAELLLVAHYDSRYSQPFARDTVWSYGAADDGYGVGVILETVSQLLKVRDQWSQGVKVLFTDAEEVGMMGMSAMWENDRQEFDNVGLMINVEARGPWGPALLFEACPGNSKVMDLYASNTSYPYTYSLTTVVYEFMPNFTDFTIVKDSIPGLNFSTITDVNRYHTHLDNFDNISQKSIQHYGEQILPLALKYVTDQAYSDTEALKSEDDAVNFTIPLLGMFNFSKIGYTIVNVVIFVLFLLLFALEGVRGRLNAKKVLVKSLTVLGASLGVLVVGSFISMVCCSIAGVPFKLFGTVQGVMFDNVAMIVSSDDNHFCTHLRDGKSKGCKVSCQFHEGERFCQCSKESCLQCSVWYIVAAFYPQCGTSFHTGREYDVPYTVGICDICNDTLPSYQSEAMDCGCCRAYPAPCLLVLLCACNGLDHRRIRSGNDAFVLCCNALDSTCRYLPDVV